MHSAEVIIKDTHRGLRYVDGKLDAVLEAGRYEIPHRWNLPFFRQPLIEILLIDIRERDLTIKGQEILTADKVAIRVSIIVQFRVSDPRAALHKVDSFEDRLYTDVQLAARRSLASTNLEEILTNRNRLSEDILRDVKESASGYGVDIRRADVKDLVFPGNLQEIMNRVLAAERLSEAQLIEARSKAEVQRIHSTAAAQARQQEGEAQAAAQRLAAQAEAEVQRVKTQSDVESLRAREVAAAAYATHPALLRLQELDTLRELGRSAQAKLNIAFSLRPPPSEDDPGESGA